MTHGIWLRCLVAGALLGGAGGAVLSQESQLTDDEVVVRTEGAHRLLLPKDWPVEQKDGLIAPIPLEEYLSMKFDQVAGTFDATSRRLDALERRLKQLEEEHQVLLRRLRGLQERQHEEGR